MPGHREHSRASRVLLGRSYPAVDAMMDSPSKYLYGAHHIVLHDMAAVRIAIRLWGEEAGLAATLHIALDMGMLTMADVKSWEQVRRGFGRKPSARARRVRS